LSFVSIGQIKFNSSPVCYCFKFCYRCGTNRILEFSVNHGNIVR
jgi:hypothetical protein